MKQSRQPKRIFDLNFKLQVLKDYYEGQVTKYSICKKYEISTSEFSCWEHAFDNKVISLPENLTELESLVYMVRNKKIAQEALTTHVLSEEERLRDENERLRKALAYSELRNQGLNEIIKISSEKYGIDLLKKAGAKQ